MPDYFGGEFKGDYLIPKPPPDPSEDEIKKKTAFTCRQSAIFTLLFVLALLFLLFLETSGRDSRAQAPPPEETEESTSTNTPTPGPTAPRQLVYIPEVAYQMTLQPNNPRMLAVLYARMTQRPDLVWHPTATLSPTPEPTKTEPAVARQIAQPTSTSTNTATPEPTAPSELVYIPEVAHNLTVQPDNPTVLAVLRARMTQRPDLVWYPTATLTPTLPPAATLTANASFLLTYLPTAFTPAPTATPKPPTATATATATPPATTDPQYPAYIQRVQREQMTQTAVALTPFIITVPAPEAEETIANYLIKQIIQGLFLWHWTNVTGGPRGPYESRCYYLLECANPDDLMEGAHGCARNYNNRRWESCIIRAFYDDVATTEARATRAAVRQTEAAVEKTQAAKNRAVAGATNHAAACVIRSPYCYRTPEGWGSLPTVSPSTPNPIPPPTVEPSLRELAFQQCFRGGEARSAIIRQMESRGEDTTRQKNEFNQIYGGSPCCRVRDQNVCVH